MAHTNNGCVNELGDNQLPTGYSRPAVTTFADQDCIYTKTLSILKATVENATPATTMTNIFTNGTIGINKQVTDIVAADFLSAPTVTIYTKLKSLRNNYQSMAGDSPAYTNTAPSYLAEVEIYVKAV